MSNNRFSVLRCTKEYRRLTLPLSDEKYAELEQELLNATEEIKIKTWGSIVLYEFEKLEICKKNKLQLHPERIHSRNSEEALLWVCDYHLSKDNLSFEMQRYLIGKKSLLEKILGQHYAVRPKGNVVNTILCTEPKYCENVSKTRERIGSEFDVSVSSVVKYERYAIGMDLIYDISQDLFVSILRGDTHISQDTIISYTNRTIPEIKRDLKGRLGEKISSTSKLSTGRQSSFDALSTVGSIKNMPAYDPDAEIASLTLTIPSWISSVTRAMKSADINNVSDDARQKLSAELYKLGDTIFEMIDFIKEDA